MADYLPIIIPRKRKASSSGMYVRPRPLKKRRRTFTPGRDRVGGYYGRYAARGGETKFFDTSKSLTTAASTGAIANASLNLIPQGVTESQRIGRKCTLRSITLHMAMRLPAVTNTVTNPDDSVRFIMYLDKQCNGGTIAITDLMETANIRGFRNLANTSRFRILMDTTRNLKYNGVGSHGSGTVEQASATFNWQFSKACNIPLEFDSTTGAITELRSNNVGVYVISDRAVAQYIYLCRVRYSDN